MANRPVRHGTDFHLRQVYYIMYLWLVTLAARTPDGYFSKLAIRLSQVDGSRLYIMIYSFIIVNCLRCNYSFQYYEYLEI